MSVTNEDVWMNQREVMRALRVSRPVLHRLVSDGTIRVFRPHPTARPRYRASDVRKITATVCA